MQEVFEKIKERLEENKERYIKLQTAYCNPNKVYEFVGKEQAINIAIEIVNQVAEEYKNDFCEWFKYDYRTIAPKNHDVENPYWRIPEDMGKLMFCPYCGKKIKVVER